jgi:prepilin-type processing-associated H-X9-DG protein
MEAEMGRQRILQRGRRGVTVVELLCVTAVIVLLVGLVAPALARARELARRVDCCTHLRQVGLALTGFEESRGALPPGWRIDSSGRSALGWATAILPWIEQRGLAGILRAECSLDDPLNAAVLNRTIPVLLCPSDSIEPQFSLFREEDEEHEGYGQASETVLISLPSASYVGVFGTHDPDHRTSVPWEGPFLCGKGIRFAEFERGLGSTMLVAERTARKLPTTWLGVMTEGEDAAARIVGYADLGPNRDDADECEFDSRHPGRINVLWGDGRVEPVSNGVDRTLYRNQARLRLQN